MSSKGTVVDVESVQIDGTVSTVIRLCCGEPPSAVQVALKVIKHCQEEGSSSELVTGILVGLVVGTSLEITNCFPLPKDDDHEDESKYQVSILRKLREINIDYHHVGWYQSTYLNSHITKEFLESQFRYQRAIAESIVLIYDPLRTARGNVSLRAFRLTPTLIEMMKKDDPFTPESVLTVGIDHTDVLIELPVTIRNSRLIDCLLCELGARNTQPDKMEYMGLSASQILEKNMQLMMASVENLQQETYRLLGYEKNLAKQTQLKQQFLSKRKEENTRRSQRSEPPLPTTDEAIEQELNLKPVVAPTRLEALLIGQQVDLRSKEITELAGEAFAKLYLSEGLQPKNP